MIERRRLLVLAPSESEGEEIRAALESRGIEARWLEAPAEAPSGPRPDARLEHLQRLASLGALVAAATHDLANVISRLQVSLRSLEHHRNEAMLAEAVACADELATLGRDLTGYARAHPSRMEVTDVGSILDRALRLVSHRLREISVERTDDHRVPLVRADAHRLGQVFVNLLHNAIDAIEATGAPGRLHLQISSEGEMARVDVEDSGPGIESERLPRIFEMFYTTKTKDGGAGIGLSVSREIVRSHGGDIRAVSRPGKTILSVLLPAASSR